MYQKNPTSDYCDLSNNKLYLLQGIQDNAAHALISTSLDGTITSFNKAAENMLGYTADELIGKKSPAVFHDLDEVVSYSKKFSKDLKIDVEPGFETFVCHTDLGLKNQFEWTYIHKNGTKFPVFLSITDILTPDGEKFGYLGIAQDVSEIRSIEKQLKRSNEELAQFAYRTSHDLKAPLITIRGLASCIEEDLDAQDINEARNNLAQIKKHAHKLETLVVDILNLAKADLEDVADENIDLRTLIESIQTKHQDSLKEKRITFGLEIIGENEVYSQKSRLTQIIENLLINGIKYSDTDKQNMFINIKCTTHTNIQIQVEDNGVGIAKENQAKLFDMFSRFNPDLADGSGLGMSIIKKNIISLNGEIDVQSTKKGTIFTVTLPQKERIKHA